MALTPAELEQAFAEGTAAAAAGDPASTCPHRAQRTPSERALARSWVRGYLAKRPPAPGLIDYDDIPVDEPDEPEPIDQKG